MMMRPSICALGLALGLLAGCDKVKQQIIDEVNKAWPPVTTFQVQARALSASATALSALTPAVYLRIDDAALARIATEMEMQLASAKGKPGGTKLPEVTGIKLFVNPESIGIEGNFVADLDNPAVTVKGQMKGNLAVEPVGNVLNFQAAFSSLVLTGLSWNKDKVDASVAVPAINELLKTLLSNVSGAISIKPIDLAIQPVAPIDPSEIKTQGLTIKGGDLTVPIPTVAGVAIYEGDNQLEVMVDLRLPNEKAATAPSTTEPVATTDAQFNANLTRFKAAFDQLRNGAFGLDDKKGLGGAITRSFLARYINSTIDHAAMHLVYNVAPQAQTFNADIRPYSAPQLNCTQQTDARDCHAVQSCSQQTDTRSCGHDINVGGWNIIETHVNDPICEAAKAAQNGLYATAKAACDVSNAAAIASCQTQQAAQNAIYAANAAGCQVNQIALQGVEKLTHIGHVSGDVSASGQAVVDIHSIGVGDTLESFAMDTMVSGDADVLAHVTFDPDTAGRLACTFGWSKDLRTHVSIAQQPLPIKGTLTFDSPSNLSLHLQGQPLHIQLDPPPIQALFVAHPELVVDCTLLVQNVIAPGLTLRALQQQDFPSEISGKYDIPLPDITVPVPLQKISVNAGSEALKLEPKVLAKAVWFEGP